MLYGKKDIQNAVVAVHNDNHFKELAKSRMSAKDYQALEHVLNEQYYEVFDRYDSDVCEQFIEIYEGYKQEVLNAYHYVNGCVDEADNDEYNEYSNKQLDLIYNLIKTHFQEVKGE